MDNIENNPQVENSFVINNEITGYLSEISKWGKFLAIVGYVGMGLLVILAIVFTVAFYAFRHFSANDFSSAGFPGTRFPGMIIGFLYIAFAAVYYFPITYLYRFSVKIKKGLSSNDQQSLNSGFGNLKSLFKFMGILTIAMFSIYILAMLIAIPVALLTAR